MGSLWHWYKEEVPTNFAGSASIPAVSESEYKYTGSTSGRGKRAVTGLRLTSCALFHNFLLNL